MKKTLLLLALLACEAQASAPQRTDRTDPMLKVMTVSVERDTFQGRVAHISKETGVRIAIDGKSLQKHGITANQLILGLPPQQTAIDLLTGFCRAAENAPGLIVIRREEDGSLTITTK
jgi:hypothetical protein